MDPGLFTIYVQPHQGVKTEAVEAAIYTELNKLQSTPVSDRELTEAKNQIIAEHFRRLQTIAGRAQEVGAAQVFFGDWQHVNQEGQLINSVTAGQVQQAIRKYVAPTNRTVAILIPDSTPEAVSPAAPKEKQ